MCVNEVEAHPFFSNSKLIEFSQRNGIQVTAFSPLAKPARPWYAFFISYYFSHNADAYSSWETKL